MTARMINSEKPAQPDTKREPEKHFELLAFVAHELRTPLSAIAGWTDILADESVDEDVKKRGFDAVRRNINWQKKLIEDLLDVASIEAGKMRVALAPLFIDRVVGDAVEIVEPQAVVNKINFIAAMPAKHLLILGDDERLRQVLCNLLHNALKFTPEGGTIKLDLTEKRGFAEIAISDTGCGIALELLPFIFDCWRQHDAPERRTHRGFGLGLNISHSIVENHGGTIRASSAGTGQGATFTVRLPLAQ